MVKTSLNAERFDNDLLDPFLNPHENDFRTQLEHTEWMSEDREPDIVSLAPSPADTSSNISLIEAEAGSAVSGIAPATSQTGSDGEWTPLMSNSPSNDLSASHASAKSQNEARDTTLQELENLGAQLEELKIVHLKELEDIKNELNTAHETEMRDTMSNFIDERLNTEQVLTTLIKDSGLLYAPSAHWHEESEGFVIGCEGCSNSITRLRISARGETRAMSAGQKLCRTIEDVIYSNQGAGYSPYGHGHQPHWESEFNVECSWCVKILKNVLDRAVKHDDLVKQNREAHLAIAELAKTLHEQSRQLEEIQKKETEPQQHPEAKISSEAWLDLHAKLKVRTEEVRAIESDNIVLESKIVELRTLNEALAVNIRDVQAALIGECKIKKNLLAKIDDLASSLSASQANATDLQSTAAQWRSVARSTIAFTETLHLENEDIRGRFSVLLYNLTEADHIGVPGQETAHERPCILSYCDVEVTLLGVDENGREIWSQPDPVLPLWTERIEATDERASAAFALAMHRQREVAELVGMVEQLREQLRAKKTSECELKDALKLVTTELSKKSQSLHKTESAHKLTLNQAAHLSAELEKAKAETSNAKVENNSDTRNEVKGLKATLSKYREKLELFIDLHETAEKQRYEAEQTVAKLEEKNRRLIDEKASAEDSATMWKFSYGYLEERLANASMEFSRQEDGDLEESLAQPSSGELETLRSESDELRELYHRAMSEVVRLQNRQNHLELLLEGAAERRWVLEDVRANFQQPAS